MQQGPSANGQATGFSLRQYGFDSRRPHQKSKGEQMAEHKELTLPAPPGQWRTRDFDQWFKNGTADEVTINFSKEDTIKLMPGNEIEIEWQGKSPKPMWRLKPKILLS